MSLRKIADGMGRTKETATSTRDLVRSYGLPDTRALRKHIADERINDHTPILPSGQGGFYVADPATTEGQADIMIFVRKTRHMASELLKMAASLESVIAG